MYTVFAYVLPLQQRILQHGYLVSPPIVTSKILRMDRSSRIVGSRLSFTCCCHSFVSGGKAVTHSHGLRAELARRKKERHTKPPAPIHLPFRTCLQAASYGTTVWLRAGPYFSWPDREAQAMPVAHAGQGHSYRQSDRKAMRKASDLRHGACMVGVGGLKR